MTKASLSRGLRRGAVGLAAVGALAGCGTATKASSGASRSAGGTGMASSSMSSSMKGMDMSDSSSGGASAGGSGTDVNGIKAVPTQVLGTAYWQGMKIVAQSMTAPPFIVYNGTSKQVVKPSKTTSFHLMVMLNDAHTGVPIPYSTVWATIKKAGKVVYDERQWPMISAFMGPHYGNDVSLPGAGEYQLSLLISPPVSARHMEYANVWLHPHTTTLNFHWSGNGHAS